MVCPLLVMSYSMSRMKLWSYILFLMVVKESIAMPPVNHCLSNFEDSLKQTLTLKKSCEEANLRDCCQIAEASKIIDNENYTPGSGIYDISNVCQSKAAFTRDIHPPMQVRCEMESNSGGWTVLVRRTPDVERRELFNRTWEEYENGFGNLTGEFWYGLKNIHCLTSREPMEVEVMLQKKGGPGFIFKYGTFRVDGPSTSYTLHVKDKQHLENENDLQIYHDGMKFSTMDRDNDLYDGHCSLIRNNVGWWFSNCHRVYLTRPDQPFFHTAAADLFDYAELRVRPKSCDVNEQPPTSCDK